ncbi:MAG: redox-regulated ATPase YchF [Candidatus Diapherotrites archaeon]
MHDPPSFGQSKQTVNNTFKEKVFGGFILIGIVGRTNTGKTTFFSAATLVDAEIANRPFVTIKPNQGTAFVTAKCPHLDLGKECNPVNSKCVNGTRLIPITLLDVAGLVPDAWKGKGLGNQFLNDLMQAKALIHVVDASGRTDAEGNATSGYDPCNDVRFLEKEIAEWIRGILQKNWHVISKKASMDVKGPAEALAQQLSGLGVSVDDVKEVLKKGFDLKPEHWGEEELLKFSDEIRRKSKPMLIVANKMDVNGAKENFEKMKREFPEYKIVACCSEAELALRKAAKNGLLEYLPGEKDFKVLKELPEVQAKALEFLKKNVLEQFENTGVQQAINAAAFDLLELIAVYPVQDQHKWMSGQGNILPDTFLLKKGSSALELAGAVHTDFIEKFVSAVDCRSGQRIGKEHALKNGDVVKIQLGH